MKEKERVLALFNFLHIFVIRKVGRKKRSLIKTTVTKQHMHTLDFGFVKIKKKKIKAIVKQAPTGNNHDFHMHTTNETEKSNEVRKILICIIAANE